MPSSPPAADPFDLQRFVDAQQRDHAQALRELQAGRKRTHWMWYVLPQLRGLGRSEMAQRYGIASLAEARAYLAHPLLGPRLRACVQAMAAHKGAGAVAVLGEVDAAKYRSCLTLFKAAGAPGSVFEQGLHDFFGGEDDPLTLQRLAAQRDER